LLGHAGRRKKQKKQARCECTLHVGLLSICSIFGPSSNPGHRDARRLQKSYAYWATFQLRTDAAPDATHQNRQ
jgi:hypothetical protein